MESAKHKNYALPIAMMFALFAMISFVTGLTNPLGVIIKNQFGVPNWMSQLGNAANFIAYAFMGIPAGMLLKRIGYKKTALAAFPARFQMGRCLRRHRICAFRLRLFYTGSAPRSIRAGTGCPRTLTG